MILGTAAALPAPRGFFGGPGALGGNPTGADLITEDWLAGYCVALTRFLIVFPEAKLGAVSPVGRASYFFSLRDRRTSNGDYGHPD